MISKLIKAELVGVVWAEFVQISVEGIVLKGPGENNTHHERFSPGHV